MGSGSEINNGGNKSGTGVYSSDGHGYCLRWNNHKTNIVEVLESLVKVEDYVDCTIHVDNKVQFQAHRVVLASASSYIQMLLQDAPKDHCNLILPGVKEDEMKTLIQYIYEGEVQIPEKDIPKIMKLANLLELKGLFDIPDLSSTITPQQPITSSPNNVLFRPASNPPISDVNREQSSYLHQLKHSSPIITTSTKISSAQSSSSPPYSHKSPFIPNFFPQNPNQPRELIPGAPAPENLEERSRQWNQNPMNLLRNAQAMLSSSLSSVYESGSDMNPLKRKKLSSISSMLMTRDTPILRNVLAQSNAADSSQSALPINTNQSPPRRSGNNGNSSENNDTNNNENSNNFGGSSAANTSGGNNGSVYVGYVRKSSDRSYHSSNGSDHSDKVNIVASHKLTPFSGY